MAQGYHFYQEQAEKAAADAKTASLQNVRERHLRAEATWRGLAAQSMKVEQDRAKAKEDRLSRIEAEKLAEDAAGSPTE